MRADAQNQVPEADAPVRLVAYNSDWPQLFEEERKQLQRVLNSWLAGPIEHIGSTAVPGLAAKPIIDIMAAVQTLERSRAAIVALQSLSYVHAPYRADIMHWCCKPGPSFRTHHLHLVPAGSELWAARIAFRDRLREDREVAEKYADLKRTLAARFKNDRESYTDGKSEFVERVLRETGKGNGP